MEAKDMTADARVFGTSDAANEATGFCLGE
jgi:hypothetical protein